VSFDQPLWLLALLAIPVLAALALHGRARRRRFAVRHPAAEAVAVAVAAQPAWPRRVAPALLVAAVTCLALALARPQASVAVPVERASVVLVTDGSGSMLADDVAPTRLAAAQGAAEAFLERVPDELLVGFVGYASSVTAAVEPTADHAAVQRAVTALRADGGTATGDALDAALDRVEALRTEGQVPPAAVVLLSDGATTEGGDPLEAAARAARLQVPVYTVALGTEDGTITVPDGRVLPVPPDPRTLAAIAERSGGAAFSVDDAGELDRVYERLGSRIGTRTERREVTVAFAGAGLLLLVGGLGTGLRGRGRLA
jgi:Ca-activated chloride channel family protein